MHALDLPVLRRSPSFSVLRTTLDLISRPPSDFLSPAPDPLDQGILTWLTRLISSDLSWLKKEEEAECIRRSASEVLASECGRQATPSMTRTFRIPSSKSDPPYQVIKIHEPTLTSDSLGLKTWSTSFLLSRVLADILAPFISTERGVPLHGLELGSGTGLVGISIALTTQIQMTLSDYLTEINDNLRRNTEMNGCVDTDVVLLDWTRPARSPIFEQSFSLVVASDFMYAADHPTLVVEMFRHFTQIGGLVVAAYPLRSSNVDFIQTFTKGMNSPDWIELKTGQVEGYDDWGGTDPVQCRWHLFQKETLLV